MRSTLARECINRLCETVYLKKSIDRCVDPNVHLLLSSTPNLMFTGINAKLQISKQNLYIIRSDTHETIVKQDMANISFASGGDSNTSEFIAYVAKNSNNGRECYVVECGDGEATKILSKFEEAFALLYNEFFQNRR